MSKIRGSKSVSIIIFAGVVLLAGSGITWWRMIYNNPTNVFNRMLASGLSSPSVFKTVSQSDDSQKLNQTILLTTKPDKRAHSMSTLGQTADAKTGVTTESIGTLKADFVRYTNIQTSQKNANGSNFNFGSVLNVWGKSDQNDPSGSGAQLFNQTLLGVVPIADLNAADRVVLLKQIAKDGVYTFDKSAVKRGLVDGRPVYTYEVKLTPMAYVAMLKTLAHDLGLKQLDQVDPAQYADSDPLNFTFDVDVWSGQLTKVAYKSSARTESFASYGARSVVTVPTTSIPVDELQTRLQQIH